jgi:L-lactate dehydrogenase complex protein LldG
MTGREAFLERVQRAAVQGRAYRVHTQSLPADIGYVGAPGDLVERFVREVTVVGGQAEVVESLAEARGRLESLLAELNPSSVLCWQHELLDRLDFKHRLAARGVSGLNYQTLNGLPPHEQRAKSLACDVGMTSCDCAIAETGTLVMRSRPGHERITSLLPPTHIAVVEHSQIVPDLIDAFQLLAAEDLPSNVTFITGPSKTGDIELQLTTGVHGPGRLHVIVIKGTKGAGE